MEFCASFAEVVNANSAKAVNHQVEFSLGVEGRRTGTHTWEQGHFRNVVLNMAAAFDAGFIDNSYFPSKVVASASPYYDNDEAAA